MTLRDFIKKLRKEQGLSQRELAAKSGISSAEISRIETGDRKKVSPDVLRDIAPVLKVPYEDLMDKAGYVISHSTILAEHQESEKKFLSIITPKLIMEGWNIELLTREHAVSDVVAKKGDQEWHIEFKYFRTRKDSDKHFREERMVKEAIIRVYGMLTFCDYSQITKYTIAVSSEKAFNIIKKFPPKMLKLNASVMLVDLENDVFVKEEQLT